MPTSHRYFSRVRISSSSSFSASSRMRRSGSVQAVEEAAQPVDRQQHQVVQAQARQGFELLARPGHAHRHEALRRRQHRVGIGLAADAPQQRLGLQPRAAADRGRACSCGTWTRARGCASCRPCSRGTRRSGARRTTACSSCRSSSASRSMHPVALRRGELVPGRVARDAGLAGVLHQVVLALLPGRRLHRLDGAGAQRLALVGDHQAEVDADHAAEAAAGVAGAEGRVEGEQRRLRVGVAQVAFGAVQAGGEAPQLGLGRRRLQRVDVEAPAAALQRQLDRLDHAHLLGAAEAEAVGHHVEQLARPSAIALGLHAREAAGRQPLLELLGAWCRPAARPGR